MPSGCLSKDKHPEGIAIHNSTKYLDYMALSGIFHMLSSSFSPGLGYVSVGTSTPQGEQ